MSKEPCEQRPTHIRHWPGKPGDFVCQAHHDDTKKLSDVMGWNLQLVPIPGDLPDSVFTALGVEGVRDTCSCTTGRVQTVTTG